MWISLLVIFFFCEEKEPQRKSHMLLQTILNKVHKIKGFVYKSVVYQQDPWEEIYVSVEPRKNSRGKCSYCGKTCPGYDRLPERTFSFIPIWHIKVSLLYHPRRVNCKEHGIVVEQMPWATGKEHATRAFQVFLAQWARLLSWEEVARRFKTSWDTVYESIKCVVDHGLAHRELNNISAVGFDELSVGKGQDKYVTLAYQIDSGARRLLWIGKDRKAKTLLRFFMDFGKERSSLIKYVCTDMWKPYLKVIAKKIPQALNVLDRFHIMKKFNEAIDDVRKLERSKMERDGYEPILTKSKWLLLKRVENLSAEQYGHLRTLLKYNLQSVRAYLLREEFQQFWTYVSPVWAAKFLDEWIRKTMLSKIEPMKKAAKMLRRHKELILNWFAANGEYSSGIIEAMNNTAKLTMKKSYGFRKYETLKYALYHKLGALPLPKLTHEFF
jgi:transposase